MHILKCTLDSAMWKRVRDAAVTRSAAAARAVVAFCNALSAVTRLASASAAAASAAAAAGVAAAAKAAAAAAVAAPVAAVNAVVAFVNLSIAVVAAISSFTILGFLSAISCLRRILLVLNPSLACSSRKLPMKKCMSYIGSVPCAPPVSPWSLHRLLNTREVVSAFIQPTISHMVHSMAWYIAVVQCTPYSQLLDALVPPLSASDGSGPLMESHVKNQFERNVNTGESGLGCSSRPTSTACHILLAVFRSCVPLYFL